MPSAEPGRVMSLGTTGRRWLSNGVTLARRSSAAVAAWTPRTSPVCEVAFFAPVNPDGQPLASAMTDIYVDADACPVKDEVYRVAQRYALKVVLVSNKWLRAPREEWLELVVVGQELDAAERKSLRDTVNDAWKEVYHQLGRKLALRDGLFQRRFMG